MPLKLEHHKTELIYLLSGASWAMLRIGAGIYPGIAFVEKFALDWPHSEDESYSFLLWSPVGTIIYKILPIHGVRYFIALNALTIFIGFYIFFLAAKQQLKNSDATRATAFLILSPVGAVLFLWIGSYDAFTFLLWSILIYLMFKKMYVRMLCFAFLLGIQHFEQAILGLLCIYFPLWKTEVCGRFESPLKALNTIFIGVVIGHICLYLYFINIGVDVSSGRSSYITPYIVAKGLLYFINIGVDVSSGRSSYITPYIVAEGLKETAILLPTILWSVLGGTWLVFFFQLRPLESGRARLVIVPLLLAFCVASIAHDHTRVFVMITLPFTILLIISFLNQNSELDHGRGIHKNVVALCYIIGATPVVWEYKILQGYSLHNLREFLERHASVTMEWLFGMFPFLAH